MGGRIFRSTHRWILPMENPLAEVGAGDLIGELAALAALKAGAAEAAEVLSAVGDGAGRRRM